MGYEHCSLRPLRQQIESRIDEVLDGMLVAPEMYGPPDGVELQALLLLELRAFVARPELERAHPRRVFEAWLRHFRSRYPEANNTLLATVLLRLHPDDAERQYEDLKALLSDFRAQLVGALPQDNPFATYDLALAIRMKRGKALPAVAKVGALYGLVGQVMRSVVRRDGGGRGKLSREYEDAIAVRPAGGFEVVPENGVGAQIVMPFSWPTSAQGTLVAGDSPDDTVRRTFARFVDVAAWASDGDEPVDSLIQVVSENSVRTRMVLDAMRLLPSATGDIEAMELRGAGDPARASGEAPRGGAATSARRPSARREVRGVQRLRDAADGRPRRGTAPAADDRRGQATVHRGLAHRGQRRRGPQRDAGT